MKAIQVMLDALEPLEEKGQQFAIKMVLDRLGLPNPSANSNAGTGGQQQQGQSGGLGGATDVGDVRKFMVAKRPQLDTERVAVLAYLLKHNRNTAAFKTGDLTKMNIDAGGRELSNPSAIARNAVRAGYLAKAGGGKKQISPLGEMVVEALPDQVAVKTLLAEHKPKGRRPRRRKPAK